jgi:hypothetical protein
MAKCKFLYDQAIACGTGTLPQLSQPAEAFRGLINLLRLKRLSVVFQNYAPGGSRAASSVLASCRSGMSKPSVNQA